MSRGSIIFDWDNTLFNFSYYWEVAHQQIFYEYEFDKLGIDYKNFISTLIEIDDLLWEKVNNKEITLDELRIYRIVQTLEKFDYHISVNEGKKFFDRFFDVLLENIKINSQLIEQIISLKSKYDFSILTNGKISEQTKK